MAIPSNSQVSAASHGWRYGPMVVLVAALATAWWLYFHMVPMVVIDLWLIEPTPELEREAVWQEWRTVTVRSGSHRVEVPVREGVLDLPFHVFRFRQQRLPPGWDVTLVRESVQVEVRTVRACTAVIVSLAVIAAVGHGLGRIMSRALSRPQVRGGQGRKQEA